MITQDHLLGGGIGVAIATYLPQVIVAPHWLGPDAPAAAETGLLLALGTCVIAGVRWLWNSRQSGGSASLIRPSQASIEPVLKQVAAQVEPVLAVPAVAAAVERVLTVPAAAAATPAAPPAPPAAAPPA